MPLTRPSRLRDGLVADRVMAIVRYREGGDVSGALAALADGGVGVLEVTVDTPGVWKAIEVTAQRPGVVVGAGTVSTVADVRRVADAGGRFVVSPGFDTDVVAAALDAGLEPLPGVATASEVLAARRAGAQLLKLFPAGALGHRYLSELLGPFADVAFVATGGLGIGDIASWLTVGAFAVAVGTDLAGRAAPNGAAQLEALRTRAARARRNADPAGSSA